MIGVELTATAEFLEHYLRLDHVAATLVDDTIRRLVASPGSPWARRDRVAGNRGQPGWWLFLALAATTSCTGTNRIRRARCGSCCC